MTNSAFNLLQLEQRPNWYEHLGQVEAAMAESDRIYDIRWRAGWTVDEGGWYSPCGTHASDWELEGHPFPEDPGYAEWADGFWHYEALDNAIA
jgi:hypothetical protein